MSSAATAPISSSLPPPPPLSAPSSNLEVPRNNNDVTFVFATPTIEAVFPTYFIVSWAHPTPLLIGSNSSGGGSSSPLLPRAGGSAVGGVAGWFYQVSWLSFGEASSVPMNVTTPLQHVVIPREMLETRFALQVVCCPRAAPSSSSSSSTSGNSGASGNINNNSNSNASPAPSPLHASPNRAVPPTTAALNTVSNTTTAQTQSQSQQQQQPSAASSSSAALARIIWSRSIDLATDEDALKATVHTRRSTSSTLSRRRTPHSVSSRSSHSPIFASAADVMNSPSLLDLYLLSSASPIGCLPALPDVLSLMMFLGTKSSANPLKSLVDDTNRLLMSSASIMDGGGYRSCTSSTAADDNDGGQKEEGGGDNATFNVNAGVPPPSFDASPAAERLRRRLARSQRRHVHRPVLLGQGVLKGIAFVGVRCTVRMQQKEEKKDKREEEEEKEDEKGQMPRRRIRRRRQPTRNIYQMVCLDDLHPSQQSNSNNSGGLAAMTLRDVFNNATLNSSSSSSSEGGDSEEEIVASQSRSRRRQNKNSSNDGEGGSAPSSSSNSHSHSHHKHKSTAVLKLASLWELLENDPTCAIIFTGQRSKAAHTAANSLIGSLVGQARQTTTNNNSNKTTADNNKSNPSGGGGGPIVDLSSTSPASSSSSAPSSSAGAAPPATKGRAPSVFGSARDPPPTANQRTPFQSASEEDVLYACKRVFSIVFDGPLEDFFTKQNVAMCGTAKFAAQFASISTSCVDLTEEERNMIALHNTTAALSAGSTGLSVALATTAYAGSGAQLQNSNQLVPVVPEGGALIGPSVFASGQLPAINTLTQFGTDGNSMLGLHGSNPSQQQQNQLAVRASRDDGLPTTTLGGPSALPSSLYVSAPVGIHAFIEVAATSTIDDDDEANGGSSIDVDLCPAATRSSALSLSVVSAPASLRAQPFGGPLSSVLYHCPDVAMAPLAAQTYSYLSSVGAIGTLLIFNETALVNVAASALSLPLEEAMCLFEPSIASVEAVVFDSVFVHVTIRGNCLNMRPLLTIQCDSPIPSPPIEPRIIAVSTHCIVVEVRLEKLYPLLPCVPSCSLSAIVSTSFGVQAAVGVDLVIPGEFIDFLAPELSVGSHERSWATTSNIAELVTGAITAEPFFCTLADKDLSSGITHKQLVTLENIVEIINETSNKNNGFFSRISNAASRVTGRRQLTLAGPTMGGSGGGGGSSSANSRLGPSAPPTEQVSRVLADHIRSGRDVKLLAAQLMPWRSKLQMVFPWAAKPQLYEQKVRLFYAIFSEMEQAAAVLASVDGLKGGCGNATNGSGNSNMGGNAGSSSSSTTTTVAAAAAASNSSSSGNNMIIGYGDVQKAAIGSDINDALSQYTFHGPKDVTLFTNMPSLTGVAGNFIEPSFAAAAGTAAAVAGANVAAAAGATTSSNFAALGGGGGGGTRVLPTPYMEMVINSEVLRICRRQSVDLYTQSITFENGFKPVLPTPTKFANGDALSSLMRFEDFYALMFPILNAHRVFNDVSSEALLADIATLWCIISIHHMRMAFLLSKHFVILGPAKAGSTSLCNSAKQIRTEVLGKSYFRNGGGGRVSREELQRQFFTFAGGHSSSPTMASTATPQGFENFVSQLREQSVSIKEMKRLDELTSPLSQGINTTIIITAERSDIGSDAFHTSVIKPLRNKIATATGGNIASTSSFSSRSNALLTASSTPSSGGSRGMFARPILVITKVDEAIKLYVEEVLIGRGGGTSTTTTVKGGRAAAVDTAKGGGGGPLQTDFLASFSSAHELISLPFSQSYANSRNQRASFSVNPSSSLPTKTNPTRATNTNAVAVLARQWAEALIFDVFNHIEFLLSRDAVLSSWRAPPPPPSSPSGGNANTTAANTFTSIVDEDDSNAAFAPPQQNAKQQPQQPPMSPIVALSSGSVSINRGVAAGGGGGGAGGAAVGQLAYTVYKLWLTHNGPLTSSPSSTTTADMGSSFASSQINNSRSQNSASTTNGQKHIDRAIQLLWQMGRVPEEVAEDAVRALYGEEGGDPLTSSSSATAAAKDEATVVQALGTFVALTLSDVTVEQLRRLVS